MISFKLLAVIQLWTFWEQTQGWSQAAIEKEGQKKIVKYSYRQNSNNKVCFIIFNNKQSKKPSSPPMEEYESGNNALSLEESKSKYWKFMWHISFI